MDDNFEQNTKKTRLVTKPILSSEMVSESDTDSEITSESDQSSLEKGGKNLVLQYQKIASWRL